MAADAVKRGGTSSRGKKRPPKRPASTPAEPVVPAVAVAPAMPAVDLPPRSQHEPASPGPSRRRRSASRLPVIVAPVDLPDDAAGRVEIFVVRSLDDRNEVPATSELELTSAPQALPMGTGWVAVAVLATFLVAVFVLGSLLFR